MRQTFAKKHEGALSIAFLLTSFAVIAAMVMIFSPNVPTKTQRATCTNSGGRVITKEFTLKPGVWNGVHSGDIHYCEGSDGNMMAVWNDVINPNGKIHWYDPQSSFIKLAKRCTANGGITYNTSYKVGKYNYHHTAVCVTNGKITDYQD